MGCGRWLLRCCEAAYILQAGNIGATWRRLACPPVFPPGRKSCAISTANRLAAFLGDERIKDKGLNCTYVIAKQPANQPTSERAIPVSIFSAEPPVARAWLRKWCGGNIGEGRGRRGVQVALSEILALWTTPCWFKAPGFYGQRHGIMPAMYMCSMQCLH